MIAEALSVLSFFAGTPGLCMAADPNNPGTYDSQQLDTASCPGLQLVVHTLGSPEPWGLEVFSVTPDFIRLVVNGGYSFDYDGWRDRIFYINKRAVGIEWILSSFVPHPYPDLDIYGINWLVSNYADPWYPHDIACQPDPDPPWQYPGRRFQNWVNHGIWQKFLYDTRDGTPVGPYDVEVIQMNGIMGDTIERYLYGRWIDPVDGQERGLGLIGFETDRVSVPWDPSSELLEVKFSLNRYLVNCKLDVPCFRCPDLIRKKAIVDKYPDRQPEKRMPEK